MPSGDTRSAISPWLKRKLDAVPDGLGPLLVVPSAERHAEIKKWCDTYLKRDRNMRNENFEGFRNSVASYIENNRWVLLASALIERDGLKAVGERNIRNVERLVLAVTPDIDLFERCGKRKEFASAGSQTESSWT